MHGAMRSSAVSVDGLVVLDGIGACSSNEHAPEIKRLGRRDKSHDLNFYGTTTRHSSLRRSDATRTFLR